MSKLTKEQLQGMSDSEVNKYLEQLTGMYCEDCVGKYINTMDYCNTPNDIMPLAFERNISIVSSDGGISWWAEYATEINSNFIMCSKQSYQDTNPLRAIACCLILVLQEGK